MLSLSLAIKAEVRSRVYWTNVLIDPKISVDIIVTGFTGQIARTSILYTHDQHAFRANVIL